MIKKYNNKAFSLVETLLSLTLVMMFLGAFITYIANPSLTAEVRIETKVSDYISLNKYVKYNAELNGKKTMLLVVSNKVEAVIEDTDGTYKDILSLSPQLEALNENTIFECGETNIAVIYLPTGEIEENGELTMIIENNNTNRIALINIGEFDKVSIIYTNIDNNQINIEL